MHEVKQRPTCHRAEDLVTYLYGEATETDAGDFKNHLQACDACRGEFAVFNQVHHSIVNWRDEALGAGFNPRTVAIESTIESNQFVHHERRLSALAAIREFFTVSPLWLRGATSLAAILLVALTVTIFVRWSRTPAPIAQKASDERMYSHQEMQAEIKRAVEQTRAEAAQQSTSTPIVAAVKQPSRLNRSQLAVNQPKQTRRPLSRQEREQLAADLRLSMPSEEEELQLTLPEQDRPN